MILTDSDLPTLIQMVTAQESNAKQIETLREDVDRLNTEVFHTFIAEHGDRLDTLEIITESQQVEIERLKRINNVQQDLLDEITHYIKAKT